MILPINKKYICDYFGFICYILALAVVCGVSYKAGMDSVRDEAVDLGYASFEDGFKWKSKRAIERGVR